MLPDRRERGFYLIGLLIVLAIIGILTYEGYFSRTQSTASTYQSSMSQANKVACDANRSAFVADLSVWRLNNPTLEMTLDNIRNSPRPINIPACPEGGTYSINPRGEIYCTIHKPDPAPPAPAPAAYGAASQPGQMRPMQGRRQGPGVVPGQPSASAPNY